MDRTPSTPPSPPSIVEQIRERTADSIANTDSPQDRLEEIELLLGLSHNDYLQSEENLAVLETARDIRSRIFQLHPDLIPTITDIQFPDTSNIESTNTLPRPHSAPATTFVEPDFTGPPIFRSPSPAESAISIPIESPTGELEMDDYIDFTDSRRNYHRIVDALPTDYIGLLNHFDYITREIYRDETEINFKKDTRERIWNALHTDEFFNDIVRPIYNEYVIPNATPRRSLVSFPSHMVHCARYPRGSRFNPTGMPEPIIDPIIFIENSSEEEDAEQRHNRIRARID